MPTPNPYNIDPLKWEFEFGQRDVHPAMMTDLWLRAIRDKMPGELRLPVKSPNYLFTAEYKGYIESAHKKDILEKIKEAVKERAYQQYIFDRTIEVVEEFGEVIESIKDVAEDTSKEVLIEKWAKLDAKYLEMVPWYWIPWYLTEENVLSDRVKKSLEPYKEEIEKVIDFNTAVGILLFPVKLVTFQKEQHDFFEMVTMAKKEDFESHPLFQDLAKKYLDNYSWLRTYFLLPIELLTYEELVEKVKDITKGNQLEEYNDQEKKKAEYKEMTEKLMNLWSGNAQLLQEIEDARELGFILSASVEHGIKYSARLFPFLKHVAKELGIPYKHLIHIKSEEIIPLLKGEKKVSEEEIEQRVQATAAIHQEGSIKWMFGDEAKDFSAWIEANVGKLAADIKEFKGQPAFKGKVKGKVRVALTPSETKDLADGEILVTSMTSPDYVPAMRRAGAIVTNEGGLLSHAAIMSREFGKPCIVGTKIATKVLKTGDVVGVDAERGIVTILK